MAITGASLPAVNQYDVNKTILEPLFLGQDYMQYMDVMPNVAGTIVIDRFQALSGITKALLQVLFLLNQEIKVLL